MTVNSDEKEKIFQTINFSSTFPTIEFSNYLSELFMLKIFGIILIPNNLHARFENNVREMK